MQEQSQTTTNLDSLKYEIAEELGLLDKVFESGWKSLTAKESGKIGGILAKRKKQGQKSHNQDAPVPSDRVAGEEL